MPRRRPSAKPAAPPPLTRGEADLVLMRAIVAFLGGWEDCLPACRRHRSCASPAVACFDANREPIRAVLDALAGWRRLDGPRDPVAAAAPLAGPLID